GATPVRVVGGVGTGGGIRSAREAVGQAVKQATNETLSTTCVAGAGVSLMVAHDAAAKFVILNPADGTVDAPITVTVQLRDQFGNVVSSGPDKDKDVTLNTSGAATGGGVVDIVNGVGTKSISDQIAQTVNLSLSDSQGTGFN